MMFIEQAINDIIAREGDFSDHPADRGGPTRWGITEAVARLHGFSGDMRALPVSMARDIYRLQYYLKPHFDEVAELSRRVAEELIDTGVNMGPPVAAAMLQRALNVLNNEQKLFPDIQADGYIGHNTLAALHTYLQQRGRDGEDVLLKVLNALQGVRYIEIAERRASQEAFVYGWFRGRVT